MCRDKATDEGCEYLQTYHFVWLRLLVHVNTNLEVTMNCQNIVVFSYFWLFFPIRLFTIVWIVVIFRQSCPWNLVLRTQKLKSPLLKVQYYHYCAKVPLSVLSLETSEYSFACFIHCQEFLTLWFPLSRFTQLHFFPRTFFFRLTVSCVTDSDSGFLLLIWLIPFRRGLTFAVERAFKIKQATLPVLHFFVITSDTLVHPSLTT